MGRREERQKETEKGLELHIKDFLNYSLSQSMGNFNLIEIQFY